MLCWHKEWFRFFINLSFTVIFYSKSFLSLWVKYLKNNKIQLTLNNHKVSWVFCLLFLPLQQMKKKFVIVNAFLAVAVLFSMLFQFVHSYEHLAKLFSEKECHHKYTSSHEITHQHHDFEHCFVCHFSISNFVASDIHHFEFQKTIFSSEYSFFKSSEITQFFKGSLFALRAPPIIIV